MSKESLLTKARELIATRLAQSQVRRGNGVVIRSGPDRNTIAVDPEVQGGEPVLGPRSYRAGEIVATGSGIKIAPFMINVYDPCDEDAPNTGYPSQTAVSTFPFIVPTISGTRLDANTPPILSTAESGVVYIKTEWSWAGWTTPFPDFEAQLEYYLEGAEIVVAPIGETPTGGPYEQLMYELGTTETVDGDEYTSYAWQFQNSTTFGLTYLGYWEKGNGVQQQLSKTGGVTVFSERFTSGNTTLDDNRVVSVNPPSAYQNINDF